MSSVEYSSTKLNRNLLDFLEFLAIIQKVGDIKIIPSHAILECFGEPWFVFVCFSLFFIVFHVYVVLYSLFFIVYGLKINNLVPMAFSLTLEKAMGTRLENKPFM